MIHDAARLAANAHYGQDRKYTGDPYIVHPAAVATMVNAVEGRCDAIVAAAWLHDVLEDTKITVAHMQEMGIDKQVIFYVCELTDQSSGLGNRAVRKATECRRLGECCAEVQTIKLADLIDNTKSIVDHDPHFAQLYLQEKEELLKALTKGDRKLFDQANDVKT
jgi:(p)ppGpp synthase/HD superfamily hydrolase